MLQGDPVPVKQPLELPPVRWIDSPPH